MARRIRPLLLAGAVLVLVATQCTPEQSVSGTAQGWSDAQRQSWYTASQGSRLIPQEWLDNLEQPTTTAAFLAPDYVAQFRYLSMPPLQGSSPVAGCPYDAKLPLGFAVDCESDEAFKVTKLDWQTGRTTPVPWVGMNCSACHTNQISYGSKSVIIDGAPSLADFQGFMEALQDALRATATDNEKFARFEKAVLGSSPAPGDADRLKSAMVRLTSWNDQLARLNDNSVLRYGFGRLDAIGHIYNKVSLAAADGDASQQISNPADAPVSYPFLWNVPQLDFVEWNGIAPNTAVVLPDGRRFNYGGLGRNTGEVIGVFAELILVSNPGVTQGYVSSANVSVLSEMENQIGRLHPPKWTALFKAPDPDLVSTGAKLFDTHCSKCHAMVTDPDDLTTKYKTFLQRALPSGPEDHTAAGTDIWMACNAVMDQSRSDVVLGNKQGVISGAPTPVVGPTFALLQHAVTGTLIAQGKPVAEAALQDLFGAVPGLPLPRMAAHVQGTQTLKDARRTACQKFPDDPKAPKIVYKGRPLQGIWATAPYLHNGSVPTLDDLLLPPDKRPTKFYMGTRQFDPDRVGFVTDKSPENSFEFDVVDAAGHPIEGNSNLGHDYGNAGFTKDDRAALIAYMKTL